MDGESGWLNRTWLLLLEPLLLEAAAAPPAAGRPGSELLDE